MSKSSLHILIPLVVAVTLACDSKPPTPATPPPAAATEPAAGATEPAAQPTDYNGTYDNSGGATLTIQNFVSDKGFDFHLVIKTEGDCNGVDYSGAVTFTEPNKATNDQDLFKLDEGRVQFEPAVDQIGMDCARVFEAEFSKTK